jgi:hypothetical protein
MIVDPEGNDLISNLPNLPDRDRGHVHVALYRDGSGNRPIDALFDGAYLDLK